MLFDRCLEGLMESREGIAERYKLQISGGVSV